MVEVSPETIREELRTLGNAGQKGELAARAGIHRSRISHAIAGRRAVPACVARAMGYHVERRERNYFYREAV